MRFQFHENNTIHLRTWVVVLGGGDSWHESRQIDESKEQTEKIYTQEGERVPYTGGCKK